ncbi:MAG: Ig-like domain-containing protein, partial [Alphaproteobacteria bacterium]
MVEPWSLIAAATAAEPAASPDDGTVSPFDPTTLELDQLLNLRLQASPRQDPDDALKDRERTAAGDDDTPRNDELPTDLTAISLGDLMNLRVRVGQQEEEKDDENTDDEDLADPQENGEEPTEAQLIAAEDAAAAAAAAAAEAGETEVAQNAGENSGEDAEAAPPQTSGGDGTDTGTADLGQTVEILPAELAYVAALQVANTVPSTPVSQPVPAPAPINQQVVVSAPPPPPAPTPDPPSNVTPVAGGDRAALNEDSTVIIKVLDNDTDADGDTLQVAAVTQGQHGHVAINIDGTLTYTPVADFFGTDAFTYTISDGQGGTSSATVSLAVQAVNDAPVAVDDAARTEQGQPVTFAVLANDTDVDGDTLGVTAVSQGANGKVAINADGTLTYFPAAGFVGTDSFTYTASDGLGGSTTGSVSVQVTQPNAPPTAADGLAAMEVDAPIFGTLTAADADNAPGELSFSLAAGPAHGKVTVQADGSYSYAPVLGFSGVDSFDFTVTDPSGASDSATVTVTVLPKDIDPGSGRDIGVNTTTVGAQQSPAMVALSGGGFVVTWESQNQDGSGFGIFAQRFDAAGQALGVEFQVNTFTQNAQQIPAMAALNDGGFVIVWDSQNQDGNNKGIFAQRFDAGGQAVGSEFQVNTTVQNIQESPDVAALSGGGFIVTWQSQNQDGSSLGIFAQLFDSTGQATGSEFQVNTFAANAQEASSVAALSIGGFVIVW